MGGSGWSYFVPYQPDINKALQELRAKEFAKGNYFSAVEYMLSIYREGGYDPYTTHPRYRFSDDDLRRWLSSPQPESVEDLIKIQGDGGTHSIIDIDGISSSPAFRTAAPLSEEELIECFGTDKPARSMVEDKADELQSLRRRWEGTYVIVYKDGLPDEIFFTGFSGD